MLMIHKWNGYVNNIRKVNIFIQMPVVIKLISVYRGLFPTFSRESQQKGELKCSVNKILKNMT